MMHLHQNALIDILGEKSVLTPDQDLSKYESGARHDQGKAALVIRPASSDEMSTVVAYCVQNNLQLIPQSGNTGLVSGATPNENGGQVIISLERLNGLCDVNRGNRSVNVGAGVRLSQLNERLEEVGLHFPIDLGADPLIGGMVATNTGGSRFLRYGDVKDNLLGLKVVLADEKGTILDLSSSLRKDNTGVDWKQLFVGTSGCFGIVTECNLNLELLPKQISTALLVPKDSAAITDILLKLEELLGTQLSAFESMSQSAMSYALAHTPSIRNPFPNGEIPTQVLLVEATRSWESREGEQSLDDVLTYALSDVWELPAAPLEDAFVGRPEEIWSLRHSLSEGLKHAGHIFGFDLSFERQAVMLFRDEMAAILQQEFPELEICDFGHIGDGGLHFNLLHKSISEVEDVIIYEQELRDRIYEIVVSKYRGSYSAEHGIGRKNQFYYDKFTPSIEKHLAAQMKNLLSPGHLGAIRLG